MWGWRLLSEWDLLATQGTTVPLCVGVCMNLEVPTASENLGIRGAVGMYCSQMSRSTSGATNPVVHTNQEGHTQRWGWVEHLRRQGTSGDLSMKTHRPSKRGSLYSVWDEAQRDHLFQRNLECHVHVQISANAQEDVNKDEQPAEYQFELFQSGPTLAYTTPLCPMDRPGGKGGTRLVKGRKGQISIPRCSSNTCSRTCVYYQTCSCPDQVW